MANDKKSLEEYKLKLERIVEGKEKDGLENPDKEHNALIESCMLENCYSINMFCGEMSIFRKNFYRKSEISSGEMSMVRPQEYPDDESWTFVEEAMRKQLERFVTTPNTQLKIYVENYSEDLLADLKWPELFRTGINEKRIHIYQLTGSKELKKQIRHITVAHYRRNGEDLGMIRMETDKRRHTAKCLLRASQTLVKAGDAIFKNLADSSFEIDYSPLLYNNP